MIDAKLRAGWDRIMRPVGRGLAKLGFTPNVVTMMGVLLQAGVAVLILDGRLLAAGLLAIGAACSDAFDGAVAKARGMTSKFGAVLDSTTDRLTDALYFLPLAWLYGVSPDIAERDEPWVAAVSMVALVAAFLVSYVRAKAEGMGFEAHVGVAERAERLIVVIAALILDLVPIGVSIVAAGSVVTFLQRLLFVRRQAVADGT